MKFKKNVIKLITVSAIFALGVSLTINANNNSVTKVEAAQYLNDYDPYTYNGSYYEEIDFTASEGMNGKIREDITNLIIPEDFYSYYSSGNDHLSTQLQYADEDPTNSDNMVYFYTRDSVAKNPATSWNREHVWCQSLSNGNWGTEKGGTDLLHIRPVYESVNSSRGNNVYADLNKSGAKYYEGKLYGYANNDYFEPIDQVKGDVARIIMYMWTAYKDYENYSDLNITDIIESYDTLLRWHTLDKPDALEGHRNDYVESSIQQNRNPFVDRPELAWEIFGNNASSAVKNACKEVYPSCGYAPNPNNVKTELSLADYATANSVSNGNKVSSISLDDAVTIQAVGSDANTGKVYIGDAYTEWRFYKSGNGTLRITAKDGYELVSVKGQIGTSNFSAPSEVVFTIINGIVEYNPGANFNVKSLKIIYRPKSVAPTGISLNETSYTLDVGETLKLEATLSPNGAFGNITWLTDDEDIATVSNSGLVTAVGDGIAVITAKISDSIKAECQITVNTPLTKTTDINVTNLLGAANGIAYSADVKSVTIGDLSISSSGCGAYGNGIQMRTDNNTGTSTIYNTVGVDLNKLEFTWAASKDVSNKSYHLYVEFSNKADFSELVGTRQSIQFNNEKYAEATPVSSARFFRITHANQGAVYLDNIRVITNVNADTPDHHLYDISLIAKLYGTENILDQSSNYSLTLSESGLSNADIINNVSIGPALLNGDKGSNGSGNVPKYYTSGSSMRTYAGNTFTFTSSIRITNISFTFTSGSVSGLSVNAGTIEGNEWVGASNLITFTNISGAQVNISRINITFEKTLSLSSISMRFGATIHKSDWDDINEKWEISDYGLMLVRKTTLENTYKVSSVEEAFRGNKDLTIARKGSGIAPRNKHGLYAFSVRINYPDDSEYNTVFCAAPFIVIDDEYYFLDEMEYSIVSIANYYLNNAGCSLSSSALSILRSY